MFEQPVLTENEIKAKAKAKLKRAYSKFVFFLILLLALIALMLSGFNPPKPVLIVMVLSLFGVVGAMYVYAVISTLCLMNYSADTYLPLSTKFDDQSIPEILNKMVKVLSNTEHEPSFKSYLKRVTDTRGGLLFTNEEFEKLIEEVDESVSLQQANKLQVYVNSGNNDKECVNV